MEVVLRDLLLTAIAVAAAFRIRDLVLDEASSGTSAERWIARTGFTAIKVLIAVLIILTVFDLGRVLL